MPIIQIPSMLRSYVNGQAEIMVEGDTVGAAMRDLVTKFPIFKQHLYKSDGSLREFVNLFIGDQNIKTLSGIETGVESGDTIKLIPSIAGG